MHFATDGPELTVVDLKKKKKTKEKNHRILL